MCLIQTQADESWPGFFDIPLSAEPGRDAAKPVSVAVMAACLDGFGCLIRGDEVGCEEGAEDVGEFGFGGAVFADEEALEDCLIETAAYLLWCVLWTSPVSVDRVGLGGLLFCCSG